jgi:hypothetical protein
MVSRRYLEAVERSFGADCSYGQVIKHYHGEPAIDTARRYSPGVVVGVRRHRLIGISTGSARATLSVGTSRSGCSNGASRG